MKLIILLVSLMISINLYGQGTLTNTTSRLYQTLDGSPIKGQSGYLLVKENRKDPKSRTIKIQYVRLESTSKNPKTPVVYLEGGGSPCTWQAEIPKHLQDWLPILAVSDLIFVDQRGTSDQDLIYLWKKEYPNDFLISEVEANNHYRALCKEALSDFEERGIDVTGYNVLEHAMDIKDLTEALGIEEYSILGFSFGTHIGMALLKLYPKQIKNTVFVGADGLNQSFNYPLLLDQHFNKIARMVSEDSVISKTIPDLNLFFEKVSNRLSTNPAELVVKHPLTKEDINVKVGSFGLALILRLDIDDAFDIPVIPRLLYTIDKGDYTMLQWFVQKRISFAFGLPGNGINQALASGVSNKRSKKIEKQAINSLFGNVVNFPFYAARDVWLNNQLDLDTTTTISSDARTLFVTGSLDCRTPVSQVNEIKKGFNNATHLIVENAGHEQTLWNTEIFDKAIVRFLLGEDVSNVKASSENIRFIPLEGRFESHPSVN
ncbi:alpha/beta hydrolase [Yeosuana sp.]|uniref:alpha/beta hydrolase n=1 Tax=Yeosuana sp. TaxID=2529388 RepID=UPI00404A4D00